VDLVMKGGEPQKRSTLTAGEPGSLFRAESSDQPALARESPYVALEVAGAKDCFGLY
jgi:hypothetical protein